MVSPSSYSESPISGMRLSSVVPAKQTGNKDHPLTDLDLAVKLHYVRAVYFFDSEAVRGLTINDLKTPMFKLLDIYFTAAGRIRRSETTGRPFLKCNDGGVRVVEAFCDKTIDDWLNINGDSRDNCLAYYQTLGPDLPFSPPVLVQVINVLVNIIYLLIKIKILPNHIQKKKYIRGLSFFLLKTLLLSHAAFIFLFLF